MNDFDPGKYIAHLSIDCVIFGYDNGELKVLLSKPTYAPLHWSLPGGYIEKNEGIDAAAKRILKERTGLTDLYLDQFRVFGSENRVVGHDFRNTVRKGLAAVSGENFDQKIIDWLTGRFVCIGFYALVDIRKVKLQTGAFEEYHEWRDTHDIPDLAYDHAEILHAGLEALRLNLDKKLIAFELLPETFTMRELLELYEAVYDRKFAMNNFQKKMLDLGVLIRLEKKFTGAQNRAPYLYRFK